MIKRMFFILIVILIAFGLVTQDVKAGPPWPATVVWDDNWCWNSWLDRNYNEYFFPLESHYVFNAKTHSLTGVCHGKLDFSDPNILTMQEVCDNSQWGFLCVGNNGGMVIHGGCVIWDKAENVYYSDRSSVILTPSGSIQSVCTIRDLPDSFEPWEPPD